MSTEIKVVSKGKITKDLSLAISEAPDAVSTKAIKNRMTLPAANRVYNEVNSKITANDKVFLNKLKEFISDIQNSDIVFDNTTARPNGTFVGCYCRFGPLFLHYVSNGNQTYRQVENNSPICNY